MSGRATWTAEARPLVAGPANGPVLVLDEPLSMWGGLDPDSGLIIDQRHPQRGLDVSAKVLVMPSGRGSSSSSSVLAEALRNGHGPAAIVLGESDPIVVLGALVVELLDGAICPVVVLAPADYRRLRSGDEMTLDGDGTLSVIPRAGRSPPR